MVCACVYVCTQWKSYHLCNIENEIKQYHNQILEAITTLKNCTMFLKIFFSKKHPSLNWFFSNLSLLGCFFTSASFQWVNQGGAWHLLTCFPASRSRRFIMCVFKSPLESLKLLTIHTAHLQDNQHSIRSTAFLEGTTAHCTWKQLQMILSSYRGIGDTLSAPRHLEISWSSTQLKWRWGDFKYLT